MTQTIEQFAQTAAEAKERYRANRDDPAAKEAHRAAAQALTEARQNVRQLTATGTPLHGGGTARPAPVSAAASSHDVKGR